jgi:hypothetical protein
MNRPQRVEVVPGRWHAVATPPVYGVQARSILVAPARATYETLPAVTKTVRETVVVRSGKVRWERRRGAFGREKLCKVRTPAITKTIERRVVVVPPRRVARMTPAVFETVERPVLIQPGKVRHVYEPGLYTVVDNPVLIRPMAHHIVHRPPVVALRQERVLVRRGGTAWVPER